MKTIAVAVFALAAFSFGSCKKCSTCSVEDQFGASVYTAPESCGKKKKLDNYEAGVKYSPFFRPRISKVKFIC